MNSSTPQLDTEVTGTTRLEAFSDGVFGIAMTLLVLEIRLPATADANKAGTLAPALFALWPVYLAYITSFITIAIGWVNHHAMFKIIRRTDRTLLFINALLLMVVTFLNFPTIILADYIQKPDASVAAMFYSGTQIVISIFFTLLWWYAFSHKRLLDPGLTPEMIRKMVRLNVLGLTIYPLAFVVAFFSASLSIFFCLLAAVMFALQLRLGRSKTSSL